MEVNRKQNCFCEEYLKDLNGAQAAIRAGYSKKTARNIATQLLSKLHIERKINELIGKRSKRTEITADNVLREMGRLAFNDPRRVFDENGNSTIKLIEGEVDITDLENNHLETLVAGQQYNSETKEISEFSSDESLAEWEEATEIDYVKETKKSPFVFFLIIGLVIAGAVAFVVIKKRQQRV